MTQTNCYPQLNSVAQLSPTFCDPMNLSPPALFVHQKFLEFTQTHVHWDGDAIQQSHLLPSPSSPAPNRSQHQGFTNKSELHIRWPEYCSFSFNISPSSEHPGLISFKMDWLDLLAVQGTLKSLLQHHSSKASILWHSAFIIIQLSHPYMTTEKTIPLTRWTFFGKVLPLLFSLLSLLCITFLPRSKCVLISWPKSPSAVILEPCFHCFPNYLPWSDRSRCHYLSLLKLSFKPTFSLSSFTFIKRLFSSTSLPAIRVVSSAYLRLLIFLPVILIPNCTSHSPAFLMMYSAYKLNKQAENIQPWHPYFPIWNQSSIP